MDDKRTGETAAADTMLDTAIAEMRAQEGIDAPQRAQEIIIEIENQKTELRAYGFEDRQPEDFLAMAEYRARDRCGMNRKGLLISGNVGCGKTLAIRSFIHSKFYRSRDLAKAYTRDERYWARLKYGELYTLADRTERMISYNMTIDDFGVEPTVNKFGTKDECLNEFIEARYELYVYHGAKTFITTNLTLRSTDPEKKKKGIAERYGERTLSRLKEMCEIVIFQGTDQRGKA